MIVPGVLLSAVGVLLLVLEKSSYNLLIGILVLTFTGTLVTGVILVWVFLRRERDLSELQADFVSKVSHELRTPLTSIRMFTETLTLRRGDKVSEDRCIEALNKEGARLQQLIDRLLDWGRMESGRRIYEIGQQTISSIVEEAVSAFEPTRTGRHVELQVSLDPDLPQVWCDKSAMVDALVNLLSNAYKYGGQPRQIFITSRVGEKAVGILVPGQRQRDRAQRAQAHLREVLPGGRPPRAGARGLGPGPRDRAARDEGPPGQGRGRQRAGPRVDVLAVHPYQPASAPRPGRGPEGRAAPARPRVAREGDRGLDARARALDARARANVVKVAGWAEARARAHRRPSWWWRTTRASRWASR